MLPDFQQNLDSFVTAVENMAFRAMGTAGETGFLVEVPGRPAGLPQLHCAVQVDSLETGECTAALLEHSYPGIFFTNLTDGRPVVLLPISFLVMPALLPQQEEIFQ